VRENSVKKKSKTGTAQMEVISEGQALTKPSPNESRFRGQWLRREAVRISLDYGAAMNFIG
jgi:hypothetical protein